MNELKNRLSFFRWVSAFFISRQKSHNRPISVGNRWYKFLKIRPVLKGKELDTCVLRLLLKNRGPYSQHFSFFVTYELDQ